MLIFYNAILFIIGLILLIKGSDYFIERLKHIATSLNVSEFLIGVLLASIATTLPEISVSLVASIQGKSSLALGNAFGSVLVNISLILGIPSCFFSIRVDERGWKNSLFLLGLSGILGIMVLDKILNRLEGLILLILYILFVNSIVDFKKNKDKESMSKIYKKDIIFVFIVAVLIVLGAKLLVDSAIFFAQLLGIPEMIIGLTIVAFGTSLPEFANTMVSLFKRAPNIGFGNILGANVLNLLVVIGLASLISPIKVEEEFIYLTIPLMVIVISVLTVSLRRDNIIGRKTGIVLVLLYLFFVYFNLKF